MKYIKYLICIFCIPLCLHGEEEQAFSSSSEIVFGEEDQGLINMVHRLNVSAESEDWDATINFYETLISSHPDVFIRSSAESNLYLPASRWLIQKLRIPLANKVGVAKRSYNKSAEEKFRNFVATADISFLHNILENYPLSSITPRATRLLAEHHLESGARNLAEYYSFINKLGRVEIQKEKAPLFPRFKEIIEPLKKTETPGPPDTHIAVTSSIWQKVINPSSGTTTLHVSSKSIYLSDQTALFAINSDIGTTRWRYPKGLDSGFQAEGVHSLLESKAKVFASFKNQIVCLEETTGDVLWKHKEGLKESNDTPKTDTTWYTQAISTQSNIICGSSKITGDLQTHLTAFDPGSGTPLWTRLITAGRPQKHLGFGTRPSQPVLSGGIVYFATNSGAIAAVDPATGKRLWLYSYPSYRHESKSALIKKTLSWPTPKPIILKDSLISAPPDSEEIFCLNVFTGQLKWKIATKPVAQLFQAGGGHVVYVGKELGALDAETGRKIWGKPFKGKPSRVIMPLGNTLLIAKSGVIESVNIFTGNVQQEIADDELSGTRKMAHRDGRLYVLKQNELVCKPIQRYGLGESVISDSSLQATINKLKYGDYLQAFDRLTKIQKNLSSRTPPLTEPEKERVGFYLLYRLKKQIELFEQQREYGKLLHALLLFGELSSEEEQLEGILAHYIKLLGLKDDSENKNALRKLAGRILKLPDKKFGKVKGLKFPVHINEYVKSTSPAVVSTSQSSDKGEYLILKWKTSRELDLERIAVWKHENTTTHSDRNVIVFINKRTMSRSFLRGMASESYVRCYEGDSGKLIWEHKLAGKLELSKGHNAVVFSVGKMVVKTSNSLVCLDFNSGKLLWEFSAKRLFGTKGPMFGNKNKDVKEDYFSRVKMQAIDYIGVIDNHLVVTTGGNIIFALNTEGKVIWKHELDGRLKGSIYVGAPGTFVFWTENPIALHRNNLSDGLSLRIDNVALPDPRMILSPLYIPDEDIMLIVVRNRVIAVDSKTGIQKWNKEFSERITSCELQPDDSSKLLIGLSSFTGQSSIAELEVLSGGQLWFENFDNTVIRGTRPIGKSEFLVLVSEGLKLKLSKFNTKIGKAIWQKTVPGIPGPCVINVSKNNKALVSFRRPPRAYLMTLADGKFEKNFSFPGSNYLVSEAYGSGVTFCTGREILKYGVVNAEKHSQHLIKLGAMKDISDKASTHLSAANSYFQLGEYQHASETLSKLLIEEEQLSPNSFSSVHNRLSAVQEAIFQKGAPTCEITRFIVPPEIDGDISDPWNFKGAISLDSPVSVSRIQGRTSVSEQKRKFWRGPVDLSAKVYLGWDDKHLHLLVDVNDDVAQSFASDTHTWQGDGLMIAIDSNNDGGFGYDGKDYVFTQALMNKQPAKKNEGDSEPDGQYSVRHKADGTGTIYESSIPWSYLKPLQPKTGTRFGFNVFILDDDNGRGPLKGLSWGPGILLHEQRAYFSKGYTPEYFGTVILKD